MAVVVMRPHPYAVESDEHRQVVFRLIIPTIAVAAMIIVVLNGLLELVGYDPSALVQALVSAPTALGLCGYLLAKVDDTNWRHPPVRWALRIKTPDLNGDWTVSGVSYNADWPEGHAWSARMRIRQTWSTLSLAQDADWSISVSTAASLCIDGPGGRSVLSYQYHNRPKAGAYPTMKEHDGLAELRLDDSGGTVRLEGEYYSHPRDRANHGSMFLTPA